MKLFLLLIIIFLLPSINPLAKAQVLTVDPVMTSAIIVASGVQTKQLNSISNNQSNIISAQLATVALIAKINTYQQKTLDGLQYVATVVKNSYQLVRCYNVLKNIYSYQSKMFNEAYKEPLAIIFAYKAEQQMVTKAIALYTQINTLILKEDANYLMDSGDRTRLMYTLLRDLEIIEGFSAMAYYEVHFTVQEGIVKRLNPFKQFMNNDARIVKEVLGTWKF